MSEETNISRRAFLGGASIVGLSALAACAPKTPVEEQPALAETGADQPLDKTASVPTEVLNDTVADVEMDEWGINGRGAYAPNMENVVPIPAIEEPDFYDYETDVLLIGYGVGGTSAALTATNRGMQVVAMERSRREDWHEHAGVTVLNIFGMPEWLERMGIPAWNEEVVRQFILMQCKTPPHESDMRAMVKHLLNHPPAFEQIQALGKGCQFAFKNPLPSMDTNGNPGYLPLNDNLEGGNIYYPWKNTYHAVENVIDRHNQENGTTVLWNTMALNLIVDATGRVVGAKGNDWVEGRDVYVKAKAVIDCVGGFNANYDMVKYYGGQAVEGYGCNVGGLVNDGMGMRMCQGAGCGLRSLPRADNCSDAGIDTIRLGLPWNHIHIEPTMPDRYLSGSWSIEIVMGRQPSLRVNQYGKRFVDEDAYWTDKIWIANKQPGHRFYTILDGNMDKMFSEIYDHETGRYGLCEHPTDEEHYIYFSDDDIRPMTPWQEGFERAVERGLIIKADTLEELADKCGINKENFLATVERYNELCALGEDLDFGKMPEALYPIDTPPFYACDRKPGFCWAMAGGVAADEDCRVLNVRGEVIPGLYVGSCDAAVCDAITDETLTAPVGSHCGCVLAYSYTSGNTASDDIEAAGGSIGKTVVSDQRHETDSRTIETPDEAKAGFQLATDMCSSCHNIPTKANFAPYSDADEIALAFKDHNGFVVPDDTVDSIADWVLSK